MLTHGLVWTAPGPIDPWVALEFVAAPIASGAKVARTEKALFDLAYLAGTRSRLFARPPEIELPARVDSKEIAAWLARISTKRRAAQVHKQLEALGWRRRR